MEMRRVAVATALAGLVTLLVTTQPAAAAPGQARAEQAARVDFNDDGFTDLAVGAPGEDVGAAANAGALNVLYGSAGGLEASPDVFFQGSGGVGGSLEDGDEFGSAVAKGDFDGDGIFDLAVGAPGETVGTDAPPARSTSSWAPAAASPAGRCSPSPTPSPATSSEPRWPRATSTTTAASTSPSAPRARTSAPPATPVP